MHLHFLHEIMHRVMELELAETVDCLDICFCDAFANFCYSIYIRLSDSESCDREYMDFAILAHEVELSSTETFHDIVSVLERFYHQLI